MCGVRSVAIAAVALGIGLNTAFVTLVNTELLKPPPLPDPDRIVLFETTTKGRDIAREVRPLGSAKRSGRRRRGFPHRCGESNRR